MSLRMTLGPLQHKINRTCRGQSAVEYALILGAVAISLMIVYGSIGHHEAGLVTAASSALNHTNSANGGGVEISWGSERPVTSSNLRKRLNATACDDDSTLSDLACRGKAALQNVSGSLADARMPDIRLVAAGYSLLHRMHLLAQGEALDVGIVPFTPESSAPPAATSAQSPAAAQTRAGR